MRVLGAMTVANQRTLEQKISDAGPFNQRIDPHVLSDVRRRLMHEGRIGRVNAANAPWFFAGNTAPGSPRCPPQRTDRGLPAVHQDRDADWSGARNRDLPGALFDARGKPKFTAASRIWTDHDNSTMYSKEEPPQHIGERSLHGDENLDFLLRTADAGYIGIECKNVRHWMYPHVDRNQRDTTEMFGAKRRTGLDRATHPIRHV